MDTTEIAVVVGALLLIAGVIWYFFGARARVAAELTESGVQEIAIKVKGGYSPDVIIVKQGIPVKLDFYRDETSSCSETVILGDFGIARDLPAFRTTSIEFTPEKTGEFDFTCGMNMLHGKLIVN